ncbi:unnamed protein product [Orchesella dallaii]|uniref:Ricin B lectin domain-containing protein n=1 Tax=Orchesella dallaii TaxID=48710 RepID=A0ABP1QQQ6_9HEXA
MPNKKRSRNTNSHKKRARKLKRLQAKPKKQLPQPPSGESIADTNSTSTTDSVHGQSRTASQEKLAGFSESSFVSAGGPGPNEIIADSAKNNTRNNNEDETNPEGDIPSSLDWNPTISNEEMGSVGQECLKPVDTMTMDSDDKTIQANRRIVSSNIRRKKMIIWMLIFILGSEIVCSDLQGNLWSTGCHRAEFLSMLDYILWFIAYVFLAFILTVVIFCISVLSLINISFANDDYELQNIRGRNSRSPENSLNGLYSIESAANGLVLTAKHAKRALGSVILHKWYDVGSQLWLVTKFDPGRGYNLKPLENEFNSVTSTLENNAHSFNAWEFKNVKTSPGTFVIFNVINMRCLQAPSLTRSRPVEFAKCQPKNKLQHWKLNKQE